MASNRVLYTAYNKAVVSDFDSSVPRGPNVPLHVKTTHSLSGLCGAYSRKVFDGPNSKAIRWEAYKVLKALEKKSEVRAPTPTVRTRVPPGCWGSCAAHKIPARTPPQAINPRTRKALTEPFVSLAMAVVNDFLNTISGEISLEGITSANLLERIGKSKFEPGDVMQVAKRIHELASAPPPARRRPSPPQFLAHRLTSSRLPAHAPTCPPAQPSVDRHDDFPCCHDHYLRAFILREPRLKYDVILIVRVTLHRLLRPSAPLSDPQRAPKNSRSTHRPCPTG